MDCPTFDERLDALLLGDLPAAEREAMERHSAECPRCREWLHPARRSDA